MQTSAYDVRIRLHRCEGCGAPLEIPLEGGLATCSYCGARHVAERRVPKASNASRPPVEDGAWAAGADDPRSPFPPGFMVAFRREARKHQTFEQAAAWFAEKRAAMKPGDRISEAWAVGAALRLNAWYAARRDHRGSRALMESLLDDLRGPEIRDLVRLSIARDAARAGEIENAEAWLALCDSGSDVLDLDSERRITLAVIAEKKKDFPGMLRVLGARGGEVTFCSWLVPLATVLRAHALEHLGRGDQAYREIMACMVHEPETLQILQFQATTHGIAKATLERFRKLRTRAIKSLKVAVVGAILGAALFLWMVMR
jgi:DNA-directed RNA polymerase subunit RPC12/RpoP